MTAAATSDNVIPLGVARASKLLDDMITNPFFVIIFDENGPTGFAKGLDSAAAQMVADVLSAIINNE